MGFTAAELDAFHGGTIPDVCGPLHRLLFVGINPGLHTVAVQAPFARPGNRFFPALHRAGILDRVIDASAGLSDDDRRRIVDRGSGSPRWCARPADAPTSSAASSSSRARPGSRSSPPA